MKHHRIYNLPNLLTSINLCSGAIGIVAIFFWNEFIPYLILISLVADFLDGFIARGLKITDTIGKDLDSLADMVSFGLLPTALLFHTMAMLFYGISSVGFFNNYWAYFPVLLILVFSAFRLAKFNTESRSPEFFYGLNTPTNTIFIFGIYSFFSEVNITPKYTIQYYIFFISIILACSFLLISDLKMYSNKSISLRSGFIIPFIVIILSSLTVVYAFGWVGLSVGVLLYIVFSILFLNIFPKIKK